MHERVRHHTGSGAFFGASSASEGCYEQNGSCDRESYWYRRDLDAQTVTLWTGVEALATSYEFLADLGVVVGASMVVNNNTLEVDQNKLDVLAVMNHDLGYVQYLNGTDAFVNSGNPSDKKRSINCNSACGFLSPGRTSPFTNLSSAAKAACEAIGRAAAYQACYIACRYFTGEE